MGNIGEIRGYDLNLIYNPSKPETQMNVIKIGNKQYNISKLTPGQKEKLKSYIRINHATDDWFDPEEQKNAAKDINLVRYLYTVDEKINIAKNTKNKDIMDALFIPMGLTYENEYDPNRMIKIALAGNKNISDALINKLVDFCIYDSDITKTIRANIAKAIINNEKPVMLNALEKLKEYYNSKIYEDSNAKEIIATIEHHKNYKRS